MFNYRSCSKFNSSCMTAVSYFGNVIVKAELCIVSFYLCLLSIIIIKLIVQ